MSKKQFSNGTVFSEKTERTGKKILLGFTAFIIFLIIIFSFADDPDPSSYAVKRTPASAITKTVNVKSAVKLASLETGNNNPSQTIVNKFQNLLNELSLKCPNENEEQLANYIFVGRRTIEEKLGPITLFEVGRGVKESIPDEAIGIVSCAEIAAAFVTLTIAN